jgi:hypothetical protein
VVTVAAVAADTAAGGVAADAGAASGTNDDEIARLVTKPISVKSTNGRDGE